MSARFNIGDVAYVARHGNMRVKEPCPVCFGKLAVIVVLGNGDNVETPCDYCGKGYDGPKGYVMEYVEQGDVVVHVVSGRECSEDTQGEHWRYRTAEGYCFDEDAAFTSREEAEAKAAELAAEHKRECETRASYLKHANYRSYSWNVGYHMSEAKRRRKQIEYHEHKAKLCKAKTKGE